MCELSSFLKAVCGDGTGYVSISHTPQSNLHSIQSNFFEASDVAEIVKHIQGLHSEQVIFNFARLNHKPKSGRGKASDIGAFSIIGMDCDIASNKKANKSLPLTIDEAVTAFETLSTPPSIYVESGTGLHCYWRISQDVHVNDSEDLKVAKAFVADFHRGVCQQLPQYQFDSTQDLARAFRVPETINLKNPQSPLPVMIREMNSRVYSQQEILDASAVTPLSNALVKVSTLDSQFSDSDVDLELMASGCQWVNTALEVGETAGYSMWWGMASLFSKVENGRNLFHAWSSSHPDYDPVAVDAKFDQVDPEKADRTCEGLAQIDNGMRCKDCIYKGGIKSPIELGQNGKRSVITNGVQLPIKTARLWAGVHVNNRPPRLFSFENQIARVNEEEANIEVLDLVRARYEFARQVDWLSSAKNGWGIPTNPCTVVINDALATPMPPLPNLNRVVSIPVVSSEGDLITKKGYDPKSGIYYAAKNRGIPSINLNATKEDALKAAEWIKNEVLIDFPFENESSLAAALSLAFLPFVRELVHGQTPLYLLDKPVAATGATTLSKALMYPFLGKEIPVISWTSTEDERRKQITGHLGSGGEVMFYDNMSDYINSDVLASALTSEDWSDRLLQTSNIVKLKNRSVWIATGNNPQFHGQILRRIVRVRLVPKLEDPSQRTNWHHPNLLHWISLHRKEYVEAILTIIMAWVNEGMPEFSGRTLASYESWSKVLGGIIEFIGVGGFLENIKEFKDSLDSELQIIKELLKSWWEQFGSKPMTASEIQEHFGSLEVGQLWDAPTVKGQVTKTGKFLTNNKDRVFDLGEVSVTVNKHLRTFYLKEEPRDL